MKLSTKCNVFFTTKVVGEDTGQGEVMCEWQKTLIIKALYLISDKIILLDALFINHIKKTANETCF